MVFSASVGVPVTLTGSEKATCTWITPALYAPFTFVELTSATVGGIVSTRTGLLETDAVLPALSVPVSV